jgi:hypothetical protein
MVTTSRAEIACTKPANPLFNFGELVSFVAARPLMTELVGIMTMHKELKSGVPKWLSHIATGVTEGSDLGALASNSFGVPFRQIILFSSIYRSSESSCCLAEAEAADFARDG